MSDLELFRIGGAEVFDVHGSSLALAKSLLERSYENA
jgi:hypothetical protein